MSHTVTSWPSPPPDPPWGTPHSTYSTYLHILYICIYYMGYIGTYYTCAQTCWTPRISCFSGVSGGPKWGRFWAHPDLPPQIPHPIHPSCIMAPYMLICANIHTYIPYIHTYIHIYTYYYTISTHVGHHPTPHILAAIIHTTGSGVPLCRQPAAIHAIMGTYMLIYTYIHTYMPYIHTITPYLHDIQPLSAIPSTMANPWIWGSGSGYGVHQMLYMP